MLNEKKFLEHFLFEKKIVQYFVPYFRYILFVMFLAILQLNKLFAI